MGRPVSWRPLSADRFGLPGLRGNESGTPLRIGRLAQKDIAMAEPKQIEIVRRAYELWEHAGKPDGKDQEFYHQAEQELRNEDKSSPLRTPDDL